MSLQALKFWYQPVLALGVWTFQANRLSTYESLLGFLEDRGASATVRVQETFEAWAKRDKKRMETRHMVFASMASRLARGDCTVAKAMQPFISNEEFLIISSGEINGDLATALQLVVRNIKASENMLDNVAAALAQPAMGLASVVALSLAVGWFLWPDMLRAVPVKYWPEWTLPCVYAQIWLAKHWYALMSVVFVVWLYYWSRNRWTGTSRDWADHLPPWSIYKGRQAASFLGVMAALIESGRTVPEALEDIRSKSDPYMHWQISRVVARLRVVGKDAISSLRTGLFNEMILDRIEDASAGREFGQALQYVGGTALQAVMRVVNKQAQTAGVLLTLVVGALFLYITAVTTFGVQDATDNFMKVLQGIGGVAM